MNPGESRRLYAGYFTLSTYTHLESQRRSPKIPMFPCTEYTTDIPKSETVQDSHGRIFI
jgi:hypothetical protein